MENEEEERYIIRALPIQLRVINFLKLWVEQNNHDDLSNKCIAEIKYFINDKIVKDHPGQAKVLLHLLDKEEESIENIKFIFDLPPPPPIIPKNGKIFKPDLHWLDVDAKELARQLTLVEFEMLYKIKSYEFLNQSWNKPKLRHNAKNLLAYIDYFNKFSTWVSSIMLLPSKLKQRTKTWIKFIHVAEYLSELNNFNSLMAILGAFSNAAVNRLNFTKKSVPQQDKDKLEALKILMDSEGGFINYRKRLDTTINPCIPYIGLFLTDLTFTEDGNQDEYKGLINFTKRKLVGNIISKIRGYQQTGYNLLPVYQIQKILKTLKPRLSEEFQYKVSLEREPRKARRADIL